MARTAPEVQLSQEDRSTFLKRMRSPTAVQKLVHRAAIVLAAAEDVENKATSERGLGTVHTVGLWRRRYAQLGIKGLEDKPKSGRPRKVGQDKVAEVIATTLMPPEGVTHWSARRLAKKVGVSHSTVHD
ncbi:MAG: helix-turn-helix domain-containing protein [Dehalococcoidia bacterium]